MRREAYEKHARLCCTGLHNPSFEQTKCVVGNILILIESIAFDRGDRH